MTTSYLIGNTESFVKTYDQALVLLDRDDQALNLSASFSSQDVKFSVSHDVEFHEIPNSDNHHLLGIQNKVTPFAFRVWVNSYDPADVENSFIQLLDFFNDAPGRLIDVYWVSDDANSYYASLPDCVLTEFQPNQRTAKDMPDLSFVNVKVVSKSSTWNKEFPDDAAATPTILYGPDIHYATTGDGSPTWAVVRESDGQGLVEVSDMGGIKSFGPIKDNQDLSAWDLT